MDATYMDDGAHVGGVVAVESKHGELTVSIEVARSYVWWKG